jgi:hypothetical protein
MLVHLTTTLGHGLRSHAQGSPSVRRPRESKEGGAGMRNRLLLWLPLLTALALAALGAMDWGP